MRKAERAHRVAYYRRMSGGRIRQLIVLGLVAFWTGLLLTVAVTWTH